MDRPTHELRRLSKTQVEQFNAVGFFVLKDVVAVDLLNALISEIDEIEAELPPTTIILEDKSSFTYQQDELTFVRNLVVASPLIRNFIASELFQGLSHDLIGDDVRLYWDQAVYKKPGKGDQFPWHQDTGYTFTVPQNYLTCWIALTDAGIDDGCPWVIPGLHRRGALAHGSTERGLEICGIELCEEAKKSEAIPVQAGDMVVFSSLTPHKTGPNVTERIRKALIVQYMRDGMKRISADGAELELTDPVLNMVILKDGRAGDH